MGMLSKVAACLGAAAFLPLVSAKFVEIDGMKHSIQPLTPATFDRIISMNRGDGVSSMWLYNKNNPHDGDFMDEYNALAEDLKGMIRVTAVNCDEHSAFCAKQPEFSADRDRPCVISYVPPHLPPYTWKGALEFKKIGNNLKKAMPSHFVETFKDAAEYTAWMSKDASKPKVLLIGKKKLDKKGEKMLAPALLNGLATNTVFIRTMKFGYVTDDQADVIGKIPGAAKKSKPSFVLIRGTGPNKKESTREWFTDEKKMNFTDLHAWMNVYSESGMGDTVRTGGSGDTGAGSERESEPVERLRELTAKSQKELCFGQKNMCAIYVSDGPIAEPALEEVLKFEDMFASDNDRAINYSWMWTNLEHQKELKASLQEMEDKDAEKQGRDVAPLKYPTMIFVKPPKKKREERLLSYVKLENGTPVNKDSVAAAVEKIAGGAQYTRAGLPKFVTPPKEEKKKKEEL